MKKFTSQDDAQLFAAIQQSDPEAFRVLFHRYYPLLFRFLRHRLNPRELVEDFIQEIFTRLSHNRQKLTPARPVRAYLFRMTRNLLIDHLRKRARETAFLNALPQNPAVFPDYGELEIAAQVQATLDNLPEGCRLVFTLNRFEGMKYEEIARELGISIKTVESRSKALRLLRTRLQVYLAS
ncbi:MAG: RNA polymerase sigma factor [bacterium]